MTDPKQVAANDPVAFEGLMRAHNRRLYRIARSVLRSRDEAEDALQEVYLQVHRSLAQFRGESAISTWLTRMVLNECFGRLRRSARRQKVVPIVSSRSDMELDTMAGDASQLPDQVIGRGQIRAVIESKLDELPEVFRTVFVLRSVEELSVEETALCLGISEATVRSRHFRARSLMREALAQEIDHAERDLYDFGGMHCDRLVERVLARL